jgi:predicted glycosyltransferase involved in capsule biosynthesis
MQKLLNKLGLYTKRQYLKLKHENETLMIRCEHLMHALSVSEDVKSKAIKKNEELKKELEALRFRLVSKIKRKRR